MAWERVVCLLATDHAQYHPVCVLARSLASSFTMFDSDAYRQEINVGTVNSSTRIFFIILTDFSIVGFPVEY